MLTFRQLDDLPDVVTDLVAQTERSILDDMAQRIGRLGTITESSHWQLSRLEALGTARETIQKELSRGLHQTEEQLALLFDEAATRTLEHDNAVFRMANYSPVPLAENQFLQQMIAAGLRKTRNEFYNLTRTTANTATGQFERALDLAHMQMVSGGMDYKRAIGNAIRDLARQGISAIVYPATGWIDSLDVATRRAVLTGVSQTAAEVQLANLAQLGADLVETTAHAGARPAHTEWQGKVFSVSGTHRQYPNFRAGTGYGTGAGLCGWNCRHSFFPFFEGLSEFTHLETQLHAYNSKTVDYNGETLSLYDATQQQRYLERQIRRWKRESSALEAAGLDHGAAQAKVREWQKRQRDFIHQTGLRRDYFRERAGRQLTR